MWICLESRPKLCHRASASWRARLTFEIVLEGPTSHTAGPPRSMAGRSKCMLPTFTDVILILREVSIDRCGRTPEGANKKRVYSGFRYTSFDLFHCAGWFLVAAKAV